LEFCEGCTLVKQHQELFPKEGRSRATKLLGLIHCNIWGPTKTFSFEGVQYFFIFTNDCSMETLSYFLCQKQECFSKFKEFKMFIGSQTKRKLKILRGHNGGEFVSKEFGEFLKFHGIQYQKSAPYSPQQNGIVEQVNQTIMEAICNML